MTLVLTILSVFSTPVLANSQPVANDDFATTYVGQSVIIDVLANDVDPDGDTLYLELPPASPSLQGACEKVTVDGVQCIKFTPMDGFLGDEQFEYFIYDRNHGEDLVAGTVTVTIQEIADITIADLEAGWNLVSIPIDDREIYKSEIRVISSSVGDVSWSEAVDYSAAHQIIAFGAQFGFDSYTQSYFSADDCFEPGKAYWMFAYEACTLYAEGVIVDDQNDAIVYLGCNGNGGWNLIGFETDATLTKADLTIVDPDVEGSLTFDEAVAEGMIDSNIFGWNSASCSYFFAETFEPGAGYWIFVYDDCVIEIN